MRWADIKSGASRRTLRQFAVLWMLFFGGLAAWEGLFRGNSAASALFALLGVGGLPGYFHTALMRPVFMAAMVITFPIGWVVSHLVLSAIYFGIFSPIAVLFRLTGRDLLKIRSRSGESYWTPKPQTLDKRRYFHQY